MKGRASPILWTSAGVAVDNVEVLDWRTDAHLVVDGTEFALAPTGFRAALAALGPGALLVRKNRWMIERYLAIRAELEAENVVELGIYEGGSAALFALLFQPRRLVAIELDVSRARALDDFIDVRRLHETLHPYFGVDQADEPRLRKILADEFGSDPIDLVIDDASHLLRETTASFNVLFPRLRPGGLFVLEDWSWQHLHDDAIATALLTNDRAREQMAARMEGGSVVHPLSRLVVQLVLTAAYDDGIVSEVTDLRRGWVAVRRGDAPLDINDFDIAQRYGALGRALLNENSEPGGRDGRGL